MSTGFHILPSSITSPKLVWTREVASFETLEKENTVRYRINDNTDVGSPVEIQKVTFSERANGELTHKFKTVCLAPAHYRTLIIHLLFMCNTAIDTLMLPGWPDELSAERFANVARHHFLFSSARRLFISEVNKLKSPVSKSWRSHVLDPLFFTTYYGVPFSQLKNLRRYSVWHGECKNSRLDVLELGEYLSLSDGKLYAHVESFRLGLRPPAERILLMPGRR